MTDVPGPIARAIVLRHMPRVLRAGLDPDAANGPLPERLVAEAEAVSPGLGPPVASWVRDFVGGRPGLARWIGGASDGERSALSPGDPAGGGLAALDRAAAAGDDATLRDVAEALVLLGTYDRVALLAGRAAAAAWPHLDRLEEVRAALGQLSLASAGVRDAEDGPPWPELDADGNLAAWLDEHRGTAEVAWRAAIDAAFEGLCGDARLLAVGLSAIAGGRPTAGWTLDTLAGTAIDAGRAAVDPLTLAAARVARKDAEYRATKEVDLLRKRLKAAEAVAEASPDPVAEEATPPGHVVVCPRLPAMGAGKVKDIVRGYEHAIGRPVPLVATPDLAAVRRSLLDEFPHAPGMVEAVLGAFAGRPYLHAPPFVVAGPPGAGKSRFVRRLGEALGCGVYRVDGSNDAGGSFGGTERRWYSSEPCRPFMAVARHRQANPIVLVDEVDKAATRTDYGRLWDSMLQALDPENAARFPDPSLQVELDISWVTVVCTANEPSVLPAALLDRMRVVRCPEPGAEHLDALLPAVLSAIAREAGLDPRFHAPLDGVERACLRTRWRGGSVRRLRRAVEAVLRVRERAMGGAPQ